MTTGANCREVTVNSGDDVKEGDKEKIEVGVGDKDDCLVIPEDETTFRTHGWMTTEDRAQYDKISGVYVGPGMYSLFEEDEDLGKILSKTIVCTLGSG